MRELLEMMIKDLKERDKKDEKESKYKYNHEDFFLKFENDCINLNVKCPDEKISGKKDHLSLCSFHFGNGIGLYHFDEDQQEWLNKKYGVNFNPVNSELITF